MNLARAKGSPVNQTASGGALHEQAHRKLDEYLDILSHGSHWGVIEFDVRNLGRARQAIIPGLKITEPPRASKK